MIWLPTMSTGDVMLKKNKFFFVIALMCVSLTESSSVAEESADESSRNMSRVENYKSLAVRNAQKSNQIGKKERQELTEKSQTANPENSRSVKTISAEEKLKLLRDYTCGKKSDGFVSTNCPPVRRAKDLQRTLDHGQLEGI